MRDIFRLLCFLILTQLIACSFGGQSGVLPRSTYGIPTTWRINEEIYGRVVDISSCAKEVNEDSIYFYPATCSPIENAEVALFVYEHTAAHQPDFTYTAATDAGGYFHFGRHTATRLVRSDIANAYGIAELNITAKGYQPLRIEALLWDAARHNVPYFDENNIPGIAAGNAEKTMLVFLTVPYNSR